MYNVATLRPEQARPISAMKPIHHFRRLTLTLAGLLLLCVVPMSRAFEPIIPPHAHKLVVTEDGLIIIYSDSTSLPAFRWQRAAISRDGVHWTDPYQLPGPDAVEQFSVEPMPQMQCLPDDPVVCYLLDSNDQYETVIARSADGGASWQIEFEKSAARQDFRRRAADWGDFSEVFASFAPQDLEIFDFPNTGYQPVVAMGAAGVWSRQPDGSWQQAEGLFGMAFPPDKAKWYELGLLWQVLEGEVLLISLLFGVLGTAQLMILTLRRRRLAHSRGAIGWSLFTLIVANLLQFGLVMLAANTYFAWWFPWPILLILGTGAAWRLLAYYQMVPDNGRLLPYQLRLLGVSALLVLAPLLWWAWGVVPEYDPAGLAATLIALGLVPINLYLFGRASRDPLAIASAKTALIQLKS
ncbi:MAG: hypothetical protein KDE59_21100 [Anaerolineales bacterium]|nr:hypothetical protein [Anaerolineales bacterium]